MFSNLSISAYSRLVLPDTPRVYNSFINRLYFIHSGALSCICGDKEYTLSSGNHLYLIPQNLHYDILSSNSIPFDHTYFDFYSVPAIKMDSILTIDLKKDPVVRSAFHVLMELAHHHPMFTINKRNEYYDIAKTYLINLLSLIHKHRTPITTVHDVVINDAILYIQKHFYEPITTLSLAQRYHMDESVFIKKFKQNLNTTPYQYIKSIRLHIACSMLKKSTYSVTEIAHMVGYADVAAFSHAMKKTYGIYPSNISNEEAK